MISRQAVFTSFSEGLRSKKSVDHQNKKKRRTLLHGKTLKLRKVSTKFTFHEAGL